MSTIIDKVIEGKGFMPLRLREFRTAHPFSVRKLSAESGVSREKIYQCLGGKRGDGSTTIETLDRLVIGLRAMGISVSVKDLVKD